MNKRNIKKEGIEAIIFDWGGVLAPSDIKVAASSLCKKYKCNEKELLDRMATLEDKYSKEDNYEKYFNIISKEYNIPKDEILKQLNNVPPWETFEFARKLSDYYKIYILSNQMKFRTDYIKYNYDMSFFEKVFFSNEIKALKPDKKSFQYVLNCIPFEAEQCLFIDDRQENCVVAESLGIRSIQFIDTRQIEKDINKYISAN